ncbi:MAG TPA: DUF3052 family protein [Flavisolibacter sp.]|nr:DUF3052 family protein [Flavisolibacter sp.]
MAVSGYSGTPLAKKLGIKEGTKLAIFNAPGYYFDLFTDLPPGISNDKGTPAKKDFIHYFTKEEEELAGALPRLKKSIEQSGMIWISWPKKSSGVITDLTEDRIRTLALKNGLVDVKVCAVDDTWSGLKLVIPLKERK